MTIVNILMLVFIVVLIALLVFVIYFLTKNKNKGLDEKGLDEKNFEKEFNNIKNALQQMHAVNKDNADQAQSELRTITKVMTDKKSRGRYGERILETILQDAYGQQSKIVKRQYKIKSGLVDVALDIEGQGVIPIDSKFPMEDYIKIEKAEEDWQKQQANKNFENQIKHHIKKVSEYINIPQTTPYAMIFVPAESVFAEIQSSQSILDFCSKMKVYFVSPTTLLAIIAVASKVQDQNDQIKNLPKIIKNLETLNKHFMTYQNSWTDVKRHIDKASDVAQIHERSVKNMINKTEEILNSHDAKQLMEDKDE